ncbi:ABC transporter permease [Flexilinea flocculi]|jgi:inositol transport system permease protein|uniref:Ribose/xylose/arabinose/galactoside ABC-type transport system, permease component n=1 Tax=Flexilinea flocculi TaxID=1678840 RepID=A0A0S7BYZ1_9CHLR|nr:ABC transporter permease [Flexilinea flocculi]NMB94814.1 ABC transporter permease [Flexilinea flocculi]GAP41599.1 ribose/xylose/arabinose/galactoside ABC-type transport system, permease component [Flexilinea flocculi]
MKHQNRLQEIFTKYGIVFVLIVMIIAMSMIKPSFRTLNNILNILTQCSVYGILALGMTVVIVSKGIDLSVGSILALCAVIAASLGQSSTASTKYFANMAELPIIVPILAGLLIGAICGAINGGLIAFTGIPAFIATLGMMTICRGFAYIYTSGKPVSTLIPSFEFIGQGRLLGIPMPVVIYLGMIIITKILLNNTRFGKRTFAVGGNINAAEVSGVNVKKILLWVYTYMGMCAGVAAIVSTGRMVSAQPGLASGYELTAIASTTIGGTSQSGGIGTVWGAVVGALVLSVMRNGMTILGIQSYLQQIVEGVVIIVAVILDMRKNARKA